MAKELECSTRTVFRDIETLAAAGIPVWFDKATQAYCVQHRGHIATRVTSTSRNPHCGSTQP